MSWANAAEQFTKALALPEPTPGGGAAAATAGAMGVALTLMAVGITLKRKNTSPEVILGLEKSRRQLTGLLITLQKLARQDAEAYAAYITASQLPKEDPSRQKVLQDALWFAASVPADTAVACRQVLLATGDIQDKIAPAILSDVLCAQHLLRGAVACCMENIRTNLVHITEPKRVQKLEKVLEDYESDRK